MKIGVGRGVYLILLVIALAMVASVYAQTDPANAAYVLNEIPDYSKPFVETPSVSCQPEQSIRNTWNAEYNSGYNPFDITDLDGVSSLDFTLINPAAIVSYKPYGIIPIVSSSQEGISVYIKKKYLTVLSPNGTISYIYENNTDLSRNLLINVSAFTLESDALRLEIDKIPAQTDILSPNNITGIVLETNKIEVFNPATFTSTTFTFVKGIDINNGTLASPDREITLPITTGISESIQASFNDGSRKDIHITDNLIDVENTYTTDYSGLQRLYPDIDSRIQGLVFLNDTLAATGTKTVPINADWPQDSIQYVGKIPVIPIIKNGAAYKAIPIISYTNSRSFNGSTIIAGIPLLSAEVNYTTGAIPAKVKATCTISYAKNQMLKGVSIIPTQEMQVEKVRIDGNVIYTGPKNLTPGNRETVFYDKPEFSNNVNVEVSAETQPCTVADIQNRCRRECGGGQIYTYTGLTSYSSNPYSQNTYNSCITNCSAKACVKAQFGFSEINGKVPDLTIEVSSKQRADPFLQSYSQFIPGELISVVGHVDRDNHVCPGGSQRWCHDTEIQPCAKHKTGNIIWACTEFKPECSGGFTRTLEKCHHTVCGPGFVGKIIIIIIGSLISGGSLTWVLVLKAVATVVLTEVLHLPGWLVTTLTSFIGAPMVGFDKFIQEFLIRAVINYAVDYIYQHYLTGLLGGGFLEQFLGHVLTRVVAAVGQSIADPTFRADFFAGRLTIFTSEFFRETLLRAGVETVVSKVVASFKGDQWLAQFASVVAADQLSKLAFKSSDEALLRTKILMETGGDSHDPEVMKRNAILYKSMLVARSGVMQLGFSKSVEISEDTQLGQAAIEYLISKVNDAGNNGNSVVCEKEYLADPIFKPNILQTQKCPKQSLLTTEIYKVQGGATVLQAQGYYLCDGNFQSVPDGNLVTLRIIDSANNIVSEYNTTTNSLTGIDGFDNFKFDNIRIPGIPSNYTIEIVAHENYGGLLLYAKYHEQIDVVSPNIVGNFIPKTQCSSGETLDYLLRVNSSVNYPIIRLNANEWTPFSLPYVPRKVERGRNLIDNITLQDLSTTCSFQNIMWWNQQTRSFVTEGPLASLVPGRGYYIKSSNSCSLFFKSERFFGGSIDQYSGISKTITLEDVEAAGNIVLIGSLSNNYKLNEIKYPSCPNLGYKFVNNEPEPREANKMLYVIEAQRTSSPQPPPMSGFSTSANFVDELRPGKAYWIYVTGTDNCRFTRQISAPPFSGAFISTENTYQKPDIWEIQIQNITDQLMIGQEFLKYISLTPADADKRSSRTFNLSLNIQNQSLFINNSANAFYEMTNSEPTVNITEIAGLINKKEYRINLRNNENPECQNRSYYLKIQAPFLWNGKIVDERNRTIANMTVTPGDEKSVRAFVSPRGSRNDVSIIVTPSKTKDVNAYEDIFDLVALTPSSKIIYNNNTLVLIDLTATEKQRIGIVALGSEITTSIEYPGTVYNKRFGEILDITQNSNYFIYLEKKDDQYLIKRMNKTTYNSETLYNMSTSSNITADEEYVYFFDNGLVKLDMNAKTSQNMLSVSGVSIANDNNNIYWTERSDEKTFLKKISKSGSSLVIIRELEGADYELSNLVVDDNSLFMAVNDPIYGKILKIDKNSGVLEIVAASTAKSIAVDKRWLYTNNDISIEKIEKSVKSFNYVIPVSVPGHNQPQASIIPKVGIPGEEIEFPITITNRNSNSPESSMRFFINSISSDNQLERSYEGFRCIDDSAFIQNNRSSTIYICIKSSENASFGATYRFRLTISAEDLLMGHDPSMDINVTGEYVIRSPGPPFVRIFGDKVDQINFPENAAIIEKDAEAWYTVDVTNTENTSGEFVLNISGKEFELYERSREIPINSLVLGYNIYDKKGTATIKIRTVGQDYGTFNYILRTYNKVHPSIYTDSPLSLIVSPCDYNNVCNSENGENAGNCADCSSSDIQCLYEDGCDKTTTTGVEFGATVPKVDKFIVCRRDASATRCINDENTNCRGTIDTKNCYCSLSNLSSDYNIARCNIECVDNNNYYYILGKINSTLIKSPTFMFNCPTCLGNSYHEFNEWISEKEQQHLTADCCAYSESNTCGELCTAPRENYVACRDAVSFIIESSGEIHRLANESISSGARCAETRERIESFMREMNTLYQSNCRSFQNQGNLKILEINKDNITVQNNGSLGYYGIASCNYRKGLKITQVSSCKRIEVGANATFEMNPTLGYGTWSVECTLNGSWFDDCRASSVHDFAQGNSITISFPETSFRIEDYEAISGINQGKISARIKNNGIAGNAIVKCNLSSPTGVKSQISSLQKFIDFNKTSFINITNSLDETGLWSVDSCSVYHQDILQHTLSQKTDFLISTSCSNECKAAGYDYGICSSNQCSLTSVQTSYCSNCCCGIAQTSSNCANDNNSFMRSTEVRWKEGDYVSIDRSTYNYTPASMSSYAVRGSYKVPVKILSGNNVVYSTYSDVECRGTPYIRIRSPRNNSNIERIVSIELEKEGSAFLYIDDLFITELDDRQSRYSFDTTLIENGDHIIKATSCNDSGCSSANVTVSVANSGISQPYEFIVYPEYRSYTITDSRKLNISFTIKNTGLSRDRYRIGYAMSPDLVSKINTSDIQLEPYGESIQTIELDLRENTSSSLEFSVYSYGSTVLKKVVANFSSNKYPSQPVLMGRTSGFTNIAYPFSAMSADPGNKRIRYEWDWNGDGLVDETSSFVDSGTTDSRNHSFENSGIYNVKVRAVNTDNQMSLFSEYLRIVIIDQSSITSGPSQPVLIGRTSGFTNIAYPFSAMSADPGNKRIRYEWDWNGDGLVDETSSFVDSGTTDSRNHSFENSGIYNVKVSAVNTDNQMSLFSEYLRIVIRFNQIINTPPEILSIEAVPSTVNKASTIQFLSDIKDSENDTINAVVCRDRYCTNKICTMNKKTILEKEMYECSYLVDMERGYQTYYIIANDSRDVSISYGGLFYINDFVQSIYDFSIDPTNQQYEVIAGSSYSTRFTLSNTGNKKDTYDISTFSEKQWRSVTTINGERKSFIEISPNQSADVLITTEVPITNIGAESTQEITTISRSTRNRKVSYSTATVRNIINRAPSIESFVVSTLYVETNQNITFSAVLDDPDNDTITASVCADRACLSKYCDLQKQSDYTCIYQTQIKGTYDYYVIAKDSKNLTTTSSAKRFWVQDSKPSTIQNAVNQNTSITNTSNSVTNEEAENAIDDDPNTYWTSKNLPASFVINFGKQKNIIGFALFSESVARPKNFEVRISKDCTNYLSVYKSFLTKPVYKDGWINETIEKTSAKCIMLYVTESENKAPYTSVGSFEIYEYIELSSQQTNTTLGNLSTQSNQSQNTIIKPVNESASPVNNTCPGCTQSESKNNTIMLLIILAITIMIIIILILFRKRVKEFINSMKLRSYYGD